MVMCYDGSRTGNLIPLKVAEVLRGMTVGAHLARTGAIDKACDWWSLPATHRWLQIPERVHVTACFPFVILLEARGTLEEAYLLMAPRIADYRT